MMFWLAEVAGVPSDLLDEAEALAESASQANPADGHPHGRMIRTALPWPLIEQAILTGPHLAPLSVANDAALLAFDRLTETVSTYRKFRQWLPT
ncbi:hypothetical protein [Tropicimonas sp. IMCC6043]|uniref:hypothetical protein n=1 Tax=Tropicimonas sp. IMCC6043 TaxID=2510645 RepID=UPI00101C4102|nr:hypothetical protein [Tropicimonas sp. IMCC6043]RYH08453.1 hypothetical protein EU800_16640 [Tropicimonas sp. IMCC6043]